MDRSRHSCIEQSPIRDDPVAAPSHHDQSPMHNVPVGA